jgi:rod shape-determining protein MreD
MSGLLAFPVLILLVMIQMVVVSRLPLLSGTADLVLLVLVAWSLHERVSTAWLWTAVAGLLMSFVSALPLFTPLVGYLLITAIARLLQRRVWQNPILAMFVATAVGSLFYHFMSWFLLSFSGTPLPLADSISRVILPAVLLNLLLSIPVYALVTDMANWIHPYELER